MDKKVLVLEFNDEEGMTLNMRIDDPKETLDQTFVSAKMNEIISADVFHNKENDLIGIKGAYIITTSRNVILGN